MNIDMVKGKDIPFYDKLIILFSWITLALLIASPCPPHTRALMNISSVMSLLAIPLLLWRIRPTVCDAKWFRHIMCFFFTSAILSCLWRLYFKAPHVPEFYKSIGVLFDTFQAFICAVLFIMLADTRKKMVNLVVFLGVVLVAVEMWEPINYWIQGLYAVPFSRLRGTKGAPGRYVGVLYFLGFGYWAVILNRDYWKMEITGAVKVIGVLVGVFMPFMLIRKRLPLPDAEYVSGWLPNPYPFERVVAAPHKTFYLFGILLAVCVLLWWWMTLKGGVWRAVSMFAGVSFGVVNAALAATRTNLGLMILAGMGSIMLCGKRKKLFLGIFTVVVLAFGAIMMFNPRARKMTSMVQRQYVWDGTIELLKVNWIFGVGYGWKAFKTDWEIYRPNPWLYGLMNNPEVEQKNLMTSYHAHNIWLQVLAERGVLGFIAFHLLWIGAFVYLIKNIRKMSHVDGGEGYEDLKRIAILSCVSLALLAIYGLLEYPLMKDSEMHFWFSVALGFAAVNIFHKEQKEKLLSEH